MRYSVMYGTPYTRYVEMSPVFSFSLQSYNSTRQESREFSVYYKGSSLLL